MQAPGRAFSVISFTNARSVAPELRFAATHVRRSPMVLTLYGAAAARAACVGPICLSF